MIAGWQTYTSVAVVFYGIALCLLFVIPIGIIKAITGLEVTLNVLAEFIGGSFVGQYTNLFIPTRAVTNLSLRG
jgi:hypothetical protein